MKLHLPSRRWSSREDLLQDLMSHDAFVHSRPMIGASHGIELSKKGQCWSDFLRGLLRRMIDRPAEAATPAIIRKKLGFSMLLQ